MTKTTIVSRTRMRTGLCIGGITRDQLRNVRLIPPSGEHAWPLDAPFHIGDVWDLELKPAASVLAPHVEDHVVTAERRVATQSSLGRWLNSTAPVWQGDLSAAFEGSLAVTPGGACYVSPKRVCSMSVGFWRPDHDLELVGSERRKYIAQHRDERVHVAYVGTDEPSSVIAAGTLVRLSLSRWVTLSGTHGCWLQVSGWYVPS